MKVIVICELNTVFRLPAPPEITAWNRAGELEIHAAIYKPSDLMQVLERNKQHVIYLFTNFPPDNKYPRTEVLADNDLVWDGTTYVNSKLLFATILQQYPVHYLHFITGASQKDVPDRMLEQLFSGVKITRKKVFQDPELSYREDYWRFIIKQLKEVAMLNNR